MLCCEFIYEDAGLKQGERKVKSHGQNDPIGLTHMSADLPNIIWVDCEMTGLDIKMMP